MDKQKLLFIIIVVLVIVVIGLFVYFFMDQKKQQLQTAIIAQQEREQAEKHQKEKEEKAKKDKEIEDIKKGLDKLIGGKIESVDYGEKSFVVDLDPLGDHKRYKIHTSDETKFIMTYADTRIIDPNADETEMQTENTESELDIEFDQLKEATDAQIEFAKRIDIDKEKTLTATKVNVIYYKVIE